ncbi:MAG: acylphosphatase [Tissierellia bacterium]|nr:acylphosphatase [Tissierellia bacterium]
MQRYKIIFKGRVQGVGFRYRALRIANSLNLLGSVKNLYDGSVEVILQGKKLAINTFIKRIKEERFIRVEDINCFELDLDNTLDSFEILY